MRKIFFKLFVLFWSFSFRFSIVLCNSLYYIILILSMWILPSFSIFSYLNSAGLRNSLFISLPWFFFILFCTLSCYCFCFARGALLMMTQSLAASSAKSRNACVFISSTVCFVIASVHAMPGLCLCFVVLCVLSLVLVF